MIMERYPNARTIAIVCTQWGDTGKGKFVDYFAEWADIIARGTGGANAGHTIVINGTQYIFHLIPSGILYDKQGKMNVIGNGTVVYPYVITHELTILQKANMTHNNLRISHRAKLVLPQHIVLDRLRECGADGKIGTTGRGIGPAYEDHYARIGLTMNDILNPDSFVTKLRRNLKDKVQFLRTVDPEVLREIMQHEYLQFGAYFNPNTIFDEDAIVANYLSYAEVLRDMICDTDEMVRCMWGRHNILLEGAQGHLLSVDFGTYQFVTSSDCSIQGLAKGVGLSEKQVDIVFGIANAFFMKRVGEGPFPTELGGAHSATWCGTKGVTRTTELEQFGNVSVNDPDPFRQGIGIRMAAREYGSTTGRPRRIGWLDLPLLRYAVQTGIQKLILTKLDCLDSCETIHICNAYVYEGPDHWLGNCLLQKGDHIAIAVPDAEVLQYCKPLYQTFPGWNEPTGNVRTYDDLPDALKKLVAYVSHEVHREVAILSVGPEREQTIVR